jgi:hypothetical protein
MISLILKIFALMYTVYLWLPGFLILMVIALLSKLSTRDKLLFILLSALSPLIGVVMLVVWREKMFRSSSEVRFIS